jgi:hypothetical protein
MRWVWVVLLVACSENGVAPADLTVAVDLATPSDSRPSKDASGAACKLTAQDCASDEKCTWTEDNIYLQTPTCVSLGGQKLEGEACTSASVGIDDCARGLLCTDLGAAPGSFRCLRVCTGSITPPVKGECKSNELCATLEVAYSPGVCMVPCDAFAGDCPATLKCGRSQEVTPYNFVYFPMCVPTGTLPLGAYCVGGVCSPGLVCSGFAGCAPICDATHGCDVGVQVDGGMVPCGSAFGACDFCLPKGHVCTVNAAIQFCCSGVCRDAGVCE